MSRRARDNPFRVERVLQVRYRFDQDEDWDRLLERLADLGWRAAIVGPEGAGKTTLQEDLADRLAAQGRSIGWLRLNRENRRTAAAQMRSSLETCDPQALIFVDGAEQLGPLLWRRLKRRSLQSAGLVITTHVAGLLPTLTECRPTLHVLARVVAKLVPPGQSPDEAVLRYLFARHEGNLRLCLRALYDHWSLSSETDLLG